jgi:hypothetical protein
LRIYDLEFNENKILSGYYCAKCNQYNDILNELCSHCFEPRKPELKDKAIETRFNRNGRGEFTFLFGKFNIPLSSEKEIAQYWAFQWGSVMDDKQALHARFYDDEAKLIINMNDSELEARMEEYSAIALEVRARIHKQQDETRARKAKKDAHQRNELRTADNSVDPNGLIGVVKERKKRMTAGEKLFADMQKLLGNNASEVLGQLTIDKKFNPENATIKERVAKTTNVAELCRIERHSECVGSFRIGTNGDSTKCTCKCHEKPFNPNALFAPKVEEVKVEIKVEEPKEEVKAFNPSALFKK